MSDFRFRAAEDWFTVHAIRTIDDPNGDICRRELVVSLRELPLLHDDKMHLGPNPRRPERLNSTQRAEIRDSLEKNGEQFHHLNRGLTVVAKSIEVDDRKSRIRVRLHLAEDEQEAELFGLLDGGHTNEIVNLYRNEVLTSENGDAEAELARRFVNVQVLVPASDVSDELTALLRAISRARNNNVQVKRRDLENLDHLFDTIKEAVDGEWYADKVRWRDGDEGKTIDGQTLLILLMIFHAQWVSYQDDPVAAYGQKGLCLEVYKEHLERKSKDYTALLVKQLPVLLRLFDAIELEFPDAYNQAGGKFGRFTNVKKYDTHRGMTQLQSETQWKYTSAWIYPIYAGFRQLLAFEDGELKWRRDPLKFWEHHKVEIVDAYSHQFKPIASATATKVGRNVPAFQICRMTVQLLAK